MERILIIPIGTVDPDVLNEIAHSLEETFHCGTELGGRMPVPLNAFDRKRKQYHSTTILKGLKHLKSNGSRVLGVIDEDLYVPGLNFVFGEADRVSRGAVIALPRLRQEFYGLRPDKRLFHARAVKEAVHELGHTLGLGHCPDTKCIMHFSNSLGDTDVKGPGFCTRCKGKFGL